MKPMLLTPSARRFLFLQGPPGPFFRELGAALQERGSSVFRINLSGGDERDWSDPDSERVLAYRGLMRDWPLFFDSFVQAKGITDVVLFGDCRPVHMRATRLARLRGIHIHVFEEGYIRPDWMTLERDGVNGHSSFERCPQAILDAAEQLPDIPDLPPITASFGRRARDSYWHYHSVVVGGLTMRFPFYRSHRGGSIIAEGIGWMRRFALRRRRDRQATKVLEALAGQKYFLFPLQLSGDYQIRAHSPFLSMAMAVNYVLTSFAQYAPKDCVLLIKEHPLDVGIRDWRRTIRHRSRKLGLDGRVFHIDGGDLQALSEQSQGMVCVNSTSGTLALSAGIPVIVMGDAVYDVPGITHQGSLDKFWNRPELPDQSLYYAFRKVLHDRCLVRGGLASESATRTLVENSVDRLLVPVEAPDGPSIRRRSRMVLAPA
ncbi:putative capsule polysaccharide export protein [Novosphingobium sp. Rr 2-17]|uniref:capsule biosynthesis protein n=1 Tax=Novosphingobium sp. Rr 2-17 TaxID=555793 RepID=UPI000269A215|nr:capsular biosynthesis protein [Novosphingobium sp. Rr 2-17]EIZ78493.1 putative capsule polysaccharide export protein [Novosphingobium sp. Rr 2-17]